jgi:hypothetical protein
MRSVRIGSVRAITRRHKTPRVRHSLRRVRSVKEDGCRASGVGCQNACTDTRHLTPDTY